jgi:hypothetical protein
VAAPITLRESESPHSLERLLGCSLSWTLHYQGGLREGLSATPSPPSSLLYGSLAHAVLEHTLRELDATPEAAAERAATLFDQMYAGLCEALALPQHQAARATVKRAVVESARELVRLAHKHGARDIATETPRRLVVAGQAVEGSVDVVWADPPVVLDLKWGQKRYEDKLASGTALQLGAYGAMLAAEGKTAETAYFALLTQNLLAEPGGRLAADASDVGEHATARTWSAAVATLEQRRADLRAGRLEAPGATEEEIKPALTPAGLTLAPECRYCGFAGLCGRKGAR